MATSKITVRELLPSDMDSFARLCETRDMDSDTAVRRAAVVEHIAFRNPGADGRPTYIVGVQDNRVIAHLGRMPTRFCIDGEIETGSYFHDLYVHPEIRKLGGQGFFLSMKMYQAAEDASPGFVALIWTNEINIALQQARKYDQLWTSRYTKILSLDEKLGRILPSQISGPAKTIIRYLVSVTDYLKNLFDRHNGRVDRLDQFDDRFDILAKDIANSTGIAPNKDSAYLNWKYVTRPDLNVAILASRDDDSKLTGFAVVIEPDPIYHTSIIAELAVVNNDTKIIKCLLDNAIDYARSCRANRIAAVATQNEYSSAFRSRLFVPRGSPEPLFVALADRSSNTSLITKICNWHMSLGDSEGPF